MSPNPFRILHSANARSQFVAAITAATVVGRRAEAIEAARIIEQGLFWYADGFGESRQKLHLLGELRLATVLPLAVWFAVQIERWEVHVSRYRYVPFRGLLKPR
jgi:hypothetical protein